MIHLRSRPLCLEIHVYTFFLVKCGSWFRDMWEKKYEDGHQILSQQLVFFSKCKQISVKWWCFLPGNSTLARFYAWSTARERKTFERFLPRRDSYRRASELDLKLKGNRRSEKSRRWLNISIKASKVECWEREKKDEQFSLIFKRLNILEAETHNSKHFPSSYLCLKIAVSVSCVM